jgi:uncharacterized protein YggE
VADSNTVTVTGGGTDRRPPNRVLVDFEVSEQSDDRATARAATDDRTAELFATFEDHGLPDEAFHSVNYAVTRRRPGPNAPPGETFLVVHRIRVDTTDLDGLGRLLTAAVDRADTGVAATRYTLDETTGRDASDEALTRAVADAERQARTLATGANRSLGPVETMTTDTGRTARGEGLAVDTGGGPERQSVADPRPGPVRTTATVTVTYTLE